MSDHESPYQTGATMNSRRKRLAIPQRFDKITERRWWYTGIPKHHQVRKEPEMSADDSIATKPSPQLTHGLSRTREYAIWHAMIRRCNDPTSISYPFYGGKGVSVCQRWLESVANFYADMGPRPTPKHTLDRRESTGNYEPSNCQWATRHEQAMNRCNRLLITAFGETKSAEEWAADERCKITEMQIRKRIPLKWDGERILTEPIGPFRPKSSGKK